MAEPLVPQATLVNQIIHYTHYSSSPHLCLCTGYAIQHGLCKWGQTVEHFKSCAKWNVFRLLTDSYNNNIVKGFNWNVRVSASIFTRSQQKALSVNVQIIWKQGRCQNTSCNRGIAIRWYIRAKTISRLQSSLRKPARRYTAYCLHSIVH